MAKSYLPRRQDGLRDHRQEFIMASQVDRGWFHFALALMLAVCIIVSALPSPSRADRVASAAGADRAALAVQQLTGTQPDNHLERAGASYGRVKSSLEEARGKTVARLRFVARAGNSTLPKNTRTTLREHVGAGLRARPIVGNLTPGKTSSFRTGATTEDRPYMKSMSLGGGLGAGSSVTKSAGLFGFIPKVFSITPSPDLFTKTHAGGFKQSQGAGTGRSVNLGTLSSTPGDSPIITSSYPEIASRVKMSSSAAVTSTPTVSGSGESITTDSASPAKSQPTVSSGGESSAIDPESDSTSQPADNAPAKPHAKIANKTEAKITIKAEGRGSPNVNFQDGTELPVSAQDTKATPPRVMASADFDSDGVADLVTADANGTLRFYRGNVDSIYPNSPQAKQHRAAGAFIDSPFYPNERSFLLGITPDFLEAGDFNAEERRTGGVEGRQPASTSMGRWARKLFRAGYSLVERESDGSRRWRNWTEGRAIRCCCRRSD